MSLRRLTPLVLLTLALSGCMTQQQATCLPLSPPALLMRPPAALRSLPLPQPAPATTPPATKQPSG